MTALEQVALALVILHTVAAPYLAAWLVLRLCRRNYDCPLRRENAARDWTRNLERERPAT